MILGLPLSLRKQDFVRARVLRLEVEGAGYAKSAAIEDVGVDHGRAHVPVAELPRVGEVKRSTEFRHVLSCSFPPAWNVDSAVR